MSVLLYRFLTFSELQTNEKQRTKSYNPTVIVGCFSTVCRSLVTTLFNRFMRSLIILEINMFLNVYSYIIEQAYQITQIYTFLCRIGFQNDL